MNKAKAERIHARRRALERYGVEMGPATRRRIVSAIQRGDATFVRRRSLRVSIFDVALGDVAPMRVVYDRKRKELITVLPPPAARSA